MSRDGPDWLSGMHHTPDMVVETTTNKQTSVEVDVAQAEATDTITAQEKHHTESVDIVATTAPTSASPSAGALRSVEVQATTAQTEVSACGRCTTL